MCKTTAWWRFIYKKRNDVLGQESKEEGLLGFWKPSSMRGVCTMLTASPSSGWEEAIWPWLGQSDPLSWNGDSQSSLNQLLPWFGPAMGQISPLLQGSQNTVGTRDRFHGRQFYHGLGGGSWFQDDQAHYICCALNFNYYISSTPDQSWRPLLHCTDIATFLVSA